MHQQDEHDKHRRDGAAGEQQSAQPGAPVDHRAQYLHGWRRGRVDQVRQRKSGQRKQADQGRIQVGRQAVGLRQCLAEPAVQRPLQGVLGQPAKQDADRGRGQPQESELAQVVAKQAVLRDAESTQHRNLGSLAIRGVASGNGNCSHRNHQGQHDCQGKKLARALQRLAHFRARVFQILDFLAGLEIFGQPALEPRHGVRFAGEHQPILHPASRHHQPGCIQIVEVHQHARCKIEDRAAAIRFEGQQPARDKTLFAQFESLADQLRQLAVDPDLARRRTLVHRQARRGRIGRPFQPAAQRVSFIHCLELDQLRVVIDENCGPQTNAAADLQAMLAGRARVLALELAPGCDNQIGRKQFTRLAVE